MSEQNPPRRLRLKSAVAAAVGGALVLLPLSEVLRDQSAEIESLRAERALLDPMTQAVAVQRGLLGHRDVADRVLRGRLALEPERRLRQGDVDAELAALHGTLAAGYWAKALNEAGDLAQDWHTLARRVSLRQINGTDSGTAHQLLVEQSVQVMDLVSAAAPAGSWVQLALQQVQQVQQVQSSEARGPAGTPTATVRPQALDELQSRLEARGLHVGARLGKLQSLRIALAIALASLAVGAALLAAAAWRRRPTPAPEPGAGTRLGHGRRSTDEPVAKDGTVELITRLRAASDRTSAEAPPPPPPQPPPPRA